jgi:hypothetical protein
MQQNRMGRNQKSVVIFPGELTELHTLTVSYKKMEYAIITGSYSDTLYYENKAAETQVYEKLILLRFLVNLLASVQ